MLLLISFKINERFVSTMYHSLAICLHPHSLHWELLFLSPHLLFAIRLWNHSLLHLQDHDGYQHLKANRNFRNITLKNFLVKCAWMIDFRRLCLIFHKKEINQNQMTQSMHSIWQEWTRKADFHVPLRIRFFLFFEVLFFITSSTYKNKLPFLRSTCCVTVLFEELALNKIVDVIDFFRFPR